MFAPNNEKIVLLLLRLMSIHIAFIYRNISVLIYSIVSPGVPDKPQKYDAKPWQKGQTSKQSSFVF